MFLPYAVRGRRPLEPFMSFVSIVVDLGFGFPFVFRFLNRLLFSLC
jgi:hypothetical protein